MYVYYIIWEKSLRKILAGSIWVGSGVCCLSNSLQDIDVTVFNFS